MCLICSTTCIIQVNHRSSLLCWKVFCSVSSEMSNIIPLRINGWKRPSRGTADCSYFSSKFSFAFWSQGSQIHFSVKNIKAGSGIGNWVVLSPSFLFCLVFLLFLNFCHKHWWTKCQLLNFKCGHALSLVEWKWHQLDRLMKIT